MKTRFDTQTLTRIAVLSALSAVLFCIEVPVILFYKLDFSNLPVLLGAFSMGPVAGAIILAIKSLTGLLHSGTGGVGELADFIQGLAYMLPAALIYLKNKSRKTALGGMCVGTVAMVAAGILSNVYILVPLLMPVEQVVLMAQKIIPAVQNIWHFAFLVVAPFNLLKGVVIAVVTFILYKHLSPLLHGKVRRA
ncbi:MAG: ECF transporter S component [Clostridia bacterium]|nr:ECF transporter S component [Clostridia bacterium]